MAGRESLKRGDIRWFRFASPDKRRPVLILGKETLLRSAGEIPVIPFSTQARGLSWEITLSPEEGLQVTSVLKPEWMRSVPIGDLGPWICSFPVTRWNEVRTAVLDVLGLDLPLGD
jgi:mRNA interferase MazF